MNALPDARELSRILGGKAELGRSIRNIDDLKRLIAEGLPGSAFEAVAQKVASTPLEKKALAEAVFDSKARQRARNLVRLHANESERVARIAHVYQHALKVFENDEDARRFLTTAHPQLDGESPLRWLRTEIGGQEVQALLANIEFAFPA